MKSAALLPPGLGLGLGMGMGMLLLIPASELLAQADFQVNADLVVLHVTVTDHHGKVVRGLPESAFHVFEDGAPQTLKLFRHEDAPVAVGLIIDNSGSMRRKLPDVVAATEAFALSSNPDDQMFVVNFNEHVSLGLPPGENFVSSPAKLKQAMETIHAKGQTALYDAIVQGLEHIRESPLPKKVLIVVSDGGDNASTLRLAEVMSLVQHSADLVYTVGLFDEYDTDRKPRVLIQMARASGGEAFFPALTADVTKVLKDISQDIRNQYTLGYIPSNRKPDGAYRHLRVELSGAHSHQWIVRARTGYFPPTAPKVEQ